MKIKFDVTGMTCAACSARVEKVVSQVVGIEKVEVNLLSGKMTVYAENNAVINSVIDAVQNAGYGIILSGNKPSAATPKEEALKEMKIRIVGSAIFLAILMYFTMGHMIGIPMPSWYHGVENALVSALLQFLLTLPIIYLNRKYYINGFKALLNRASNMDSLIAIGSGAAMVYSIIGLFQMADAIGHQRWEDVGHYSDNLYFESAATILTLITLGKYFEAKSKERTGDAIAALLDLSPKTAVVRRENKEITIPTDEVVVGDIVLVRSGATIPVDGTVLSGCAVVDQSAITGESVPIEKTTGDSVVTATINREGFLEIRADRIGEDTTLAQIVKMVEEAGGSKAPIARLADKISGVFVPVVMAIAIICFLTWMLLGETLEFSLSSAISVLVISCPCALGLATPVAIMVGTGRGASLGILFKNAEALERLHKVDTVVIDKTGTLTTGIPKVTDVYANTIPVDKLRVLAASLESRSEHPFAKAIMNWASGTALLDVDEFKVLPGRGVSGIINFETVFGGNAKLMEDLGHTVPVYPELTTAGKTPLYFASTKEYYGAIAAADVLKEDALAAVTMLKKRHLDVVMLTGDNRVTAEAIAGMAGIEHVVSDVLPGDKANAVSGFKTQGKKVLMVGDGINDAPALITADIGMAIGTGTDIAIDSADVVLMNSSLSGISQAIELSKATIRNIKQNLFWAFFYNCLGIPVAAGVLHNKFGIELSPMLGAAAMSISSLFVVTNALRLRFFRPGMQSNKQTINAMEEVKMQTVIKVEGMMCTHCKARVESVCNGVSGVQDAVVDLQEKTVTVTGNCDISALKKAICDAGYEVID